MHMSLLLLLWRHIQRRVGGYFRTRLYTVPYTGQVPMYFVPFYRVQRQTAHRVTHPRGMISKTNRAPCLQRIMCPTNGETLLCSSMHHVCVRTELLVDPTKQHAHMYTCMPTDRTKCTTTPARCSMVLSCTHLINRQFISIDDDNSGEVSTLPMHRMLTKREGGGGG